MPTPKIGTLCWDADIFFKVTDTYRVLSRRHTDAEPGLSAVRSASGKAPKHKPRNTVVRTANRRVPQQTSKKDDNQTKRKGKHTETTPSKSLLRRNKQT